MASQQKDSRFPCLMCLETRVLKIVSGRCNHSFCSECLSSVLDALDSSKDVFPCPSCQGDCPRPWDGVKGLVDFTGNIDNSVTSTLDATSINNMTENTETTIACEICSFSDTQVTAANICSECNNLKICKDCSKTHRKKKATSQHILAPIVPKNKDYNPLCKAHHKMLTDFCQTCNVPACSVCVCVAHGDHEVERLADTIRSKVEGVRVVLETQHDKLKELQQLEEELTLLKAMAPIVDRQEILIKEIEDHAKKIIDEIIKWKEDLKTQVRLDYKIAKDIPADLVKVSETVIKLHNVVSRAESFLPNTEHHPEYLNKIESIQKELGAIPGAGAEVEERQHRDRLWKVHQQDHTFRADEVPGTYGKVDEKPKENQSSEKDLGVENIFEVDLPVHSQDAYIQCVTVIGEKSYAVAHPTRNNAPANAINIYECPGTLTHTLSENVPSFHDMVATPDGKLALLSHNEDGARGRISVFDPLTGEVGSTHVIPLARTLSFGVTLGYQYVILGDDDQGQKQIIVVDKNGRQQHKHEIAEKQFWNSRGKQDSVKYYVEPDMIACGGKFIFVRGGENVSVYEIKGTGLHRITTCKELNVGAVAAVTASIWDDLFLVDFDIYGLFLNGAKKIKNDAKWEDFKYKTVLATPSEYNQKSKISTTGGNIVVLSHGHTFKVYKVKY